MSNPSYDYMTMEHVKATSLKVYYDQRGKRIIEPKTPHHPYFNPQMKRYECGCGYVGEKLNFSIMPLAQIPSRPRSRNETPIKHRSSITITSKSRR